MKKIIITAAVFVISLSKTFAQEKFSLYVAANLGLSNAKISKPAPDTKAKISSAFGVQAKLRLANKFDLVAQPVFAFRGYESSNAAVDYDIKATYFDIPVDIEYHFTFSDLKGEEEQDLFFIGAGAYEGFGIGGSYQDKYTNDPSVKLKLGESLTDNRSSTDFGLNFVAGLAYEKFRIGFQYQKGLKNVIPKARQTAGSEINLNNFGFFFAYKISGGKKKK